MMSISPGMSAGHARGYFSREDYYLHGDALGDNSLWVGRGSRDLGLEGPVSEEDFRALCRGEAPDGNRLLLQGLQGPGYGGAHRAAPGRERLHLFSAEVRFRRLRRRGFGDEGGPRQGGSVGALSRGGSLQSLPLPRRGHERGHGCRKVRPRHIEESTRSFTPPPAPSQVSKSPIRLPNLPYRGKTGSRQWYRPEVKKFSPGKGKARQLYPGSTRRLCMGLGNPIACSTWRTS